MKQTYPENWPQFYTATIQGWKHLLKTEKYKAVIIDSLKFLVDSNRVKVSAFEIMDNHVHFIWQAMYGYNLKDIQTSFKKYTANQFAKLLTEEKNMEQYAVNAMDRKYHFWKRNSLGIELFSPLLVNYLQNKSGYPQRRRGLVSDQPTTCK